jgi:hypothetical protein
VTWIDRTHHRRHRQARFGMLTSIELEPRESLPETFIAIATLVSDSVQRQLRVRS